jgi:G:T/U-mismatch repair DNA glycosylase
MINNNYLIYYYYYYHHHNDFWKLVSMLGRPRRRWEDNIKIDVQEVGGGRGDWMELAQNRDRWRALVSTVKNLRLP